MAEEDKAIARRHQNYQDRFENRDSVTLVRVDEVTRKGQADLQKVIDDAESLRTRIHERVSKQDGFLTRVAEEARDGIQDRDVSKAKMILSRGMSKLPIIGKRWKYIPDLGTLLMADLAALQSDTAQLGEALSVVQKHRTDAYSHMEELDEVRMRAVTARDEAQEKFRTAQARRSELEAQYAGLIPEGEKSLPVPTTASVQLDQKLNKVRRELGDLELDLTSAEAKFRLTDSLRESTDLYMKMTEMVSGDVSRVKNDTEELTGHLEGNLRSQANMAIMAQLVDKVNKGYEATKATFNEVIVLNSRLTSSLSRAAPALVSGDLLTDKTRAEVGRNLLEARNAKDRRVGLRAEQDVIDAEYTVEEPGDQ